MAAFRREFVMADIYPVGVAAHGRVVWFAWVSDDYDYVLSKNGRPVSAGSKEDLDYEVAACDGTLDWEGESLLDFESLISSIDSGVGVSPDAVIDAWNFMTDLFRVVANAPRKMFHVDMIDTYDSFFSQCEIARAVGLTSVSISRHDLDRAKIVLEDGLQMVLSI
jgi:hypothetical protein